MNLQVTVEGRSTVIKSMATPAKGEMSGECNRTACTSTPACYLHRDRQKYYCASCAQQIMAACGDRDLFLLEGPTYRGRHTPWGNLTPFTPLDCKALHRKNPEFCRSQREKAQACWSLRLYNLTGSEHLAWLISKLFRVDFPRDRIFDIEQNRVIITNAILHAYQVACRIDHEHYGMRVQKDPSSRRPSLEEFLKTEDPNIYLG